MESLKWKRHQRGFPPVPGAKVWATHSGPFWLAVCRYPNGAASAEVRVMEEAFESKLMAFESTESAKTWAEETAKADTELFPKSYYTGQERVLPKSTDLFPDLPAKEQ